MSLSPVLLYFFRVGKIIKTTYRIRKTIVDKPLDKIELDEDEFRILEFNFNILQGYRDLPTHL